MKCPYCNNEMVKGVVECNGGSPLRWVEDEEINRLMDRITIDLDQKHIIAHECGILFKRTTIEGHKCKVCNKIIIDLK